MTIALWCIFGALIFLIITVRVCAGSIEDDIEECRQELSHIRLVLGHQDDNPYTLKYLLQNLSENIDSGEKNPYSIRVLLQEIAEDVHIATSRLD